jgi:multidrug efflux pump subunit AcrB
VQFDKATSNGVVFKDDMADIADQINKVYKRADYVGSLVVEAAVARLNPVVNAAGTTVLGVVPMLQDVFWVAMAVTIIFGLIAGTVLTMVMVPTLYALFYRVRAPSAQGTEP